MSLVRITWNWLEKINCEIAKVLTMIILPLIERFRPFHLLSCDFSFSIFLLMLCSYTIALSSERWLPQIVIEDLWGIFKLMLLFTLWVSCLPLVLRFSISVLSALRTNPDIVVSLLYSLKIFCVTLLSLWVMIAISSAYAKVLIAQPCVMSNAGMFELHSMFLISGSMQIIKRAQLSASPCFTPLWIEKLSDKKPFTCTCAKRFLWSRLTAVINDSGKSYALSVLLMYSWSRLS